ncbi:unnamed protein product [Soboliphyme baturini]|uniref:LIM zinc-binding domain-containing protein n=1 Tax=Soboliphyme baturini TaxID=241478 RepID=A0A183IP68_9BILA|nr:unnamed protein product [Soboliphyme baturini]
MPLSFPAGYKCPRCLQPVYFAEEVIAIGKHWHRRCFSCANPECRKTLDSLTCSDHNDEAYCKFCYKKLFGPKGYGYGQGAGTLSMEGSDQEWRKDVPNYTKSQAASALDRRSGSLSSSSGSPNRTLSPQNDQRPAYGGVDVCPRCGRAVFLAEKLMAAGKAWHKLCFSCAECNKLLESTNLCEKSGDIYCKSMDFLSKY